MYREKTWGPGQNPKRTPPFGVEEEEPAKDTEASREVVSVGTKQEEFREVCMSGGLRDRVGRCSVSISGRHGN